MLGALVQAFAYDNSPRTPSTCRKVRREWWGGVRRRDSSGASRRHPSRTTTACTGSIDRLCRTASPSATSCRGGAGRWAAAAFGRLKSSPNQVYSMGFQVRSRSAGGWRTRPFGSRPGRATRCSSTSVGHGRLPSVDTVYDDLARFDALALVTLGIAKWAWRSCAPTSCTSTSTAACSLWRESTRAAFLGLIRSLHGRLQLSPAGRPHRRDQHGRGGLLRPGDRAFGQDDATTVGAWVARARSTCARAPGCACGRAAADCAAIIKAIHDAGALLRHQGPVQTADVIGSFLERGVETWTVTLTARQRARSPSLDFRRKIWDDNGLDRVREDAVQSRDRQGKPAACLLRRRSPHSPGLPHQPLRRGCRRRRLHRRATELLIAELKNAWGIGDATGYAFAATTRSSC